MPVRFKPSSEYKKKFRWNDSIKSTTFTPTREQNAPVAGLSSMEFDTQEPALQRRRKPVSPDNKMTYTTRQFLAVHNDDEDDDIGKPSKRPGILVNKGHVRRDDRPKKNRQQMEKDMKTQRNKALAAQTRIISKAKDPPPPPAKTTKASNGTGKDHRPVKASGDAPKTTGGMQQEKDEALQYRAGIRARPGGPKYASEYQRQFAWKEPAFKESPLIAAEQMVHNSNANIAPFVPDKIPRHSEYQLQFKPYIPLNPSVKEQLMDNAQQEIKAKYRVKTKSKKAKKSALTPDRMHPAGVPSVTSHDDPRLIKATQNPQRPFFPHTTCRKWRSEYRSNFKTPQIFRYESGVWKGADPPHIQPRDDTSEAGKEQAPPRPKSEGDFPTWFSEVLELREKAKEYQQRARGTHFSREHLAQLLAEQARMWEETSSNGRSTASSGSEKKDRQKKEAEVVNGRPQTAPVTRPSERFGRTQILAAEKDSQAKRKLAWPSGDSSQDEFNKNVNAAPEQRRSSASSITTPESYHSTSSLSSEIETIDEDGRLPTPTLREEGAKQRHHLDRTTPATGGALLTSPSSQRKKAAPNPKPSVTYPRQAGGMKPSSQTYVARSAPAHSIIPGGTSKGFDYDSDDEDDDDDELDRTLTNGQMTPPRSSAQQAEITRRLQASPSAGLRTSDPHPLNDSLSSPEFQRHSERFFETSPAMPRLPSKIEPPKTWAAPRGSGGARQDREAQTNGGLHNGVQHKTGVTRKGPLERPHSGSIYGRPQTAMPASRQQTAEQRVSSFLSPRSNGMTQPDQSPDEFATPLMGRRDSDELSLSTMSNASSSTLASEVLERAKKRRDDFWGKQKED